MATKTIPSDHFTALGLPPRLCIDTEGVRARYLELSRQYHPDFHATSSEADRAESLRMTAAINNAWKVIREPARRAEYLIERFGLDIRSDKGAVPPELLEEMFDIQEAGEELREARLAADAEALKAAEARVAPLRESVKEAREKLKVDLEELARELDENAEVSRGNLGSEDCQKTMRALRVTLDRMNYLRTVLRNLQ